MASHKRQSDTTTLKSAFASFLKESNMEDRFTEKQLMASWGTLMGKPIAVRTEKLYFRDKKLFVHLNSAPLKSELDHSKKKVLEILRGEFGEDSVQDIAFL